MKNLLPAITITLLLLLSLSQNILAQDFKNCETSLKVCSDSPSNITPTVGIGMEDDGVSGSCVMSEGNSTWISWTVQIGGLLTFNLVPNNELDDLDFVVFKLNGENDCTNKELIRCMASGENVGSPSDNCTGPTGLLIGETDTTEAPGCQTMDNNYLAPIETSTGDHYVLMVNDFSQTGLGFELSFGGDAV